MVKEELKWTRGESQPVKWKKTSKLQFSPVRKVERSSEHINIREAAESPVAMEIVSFSTMSSETLEMDSFN